MIKQFTDAGWTSEVLSEQDGYTTYKLTKSGFPSAQLTEDTLIVGDRALLIVDFENIEQIQQLIK
jgi:hypothetical protein